VLVPERGEWSLGEIATNAPQPGLVEGVELGRVTYGGQITVDPSDVRSTLAAVTSG
jgi:hypothetical protein